MKNIYIIDDYISSKINGIGSYIRELTYCLKLSDVEICLVLCNYDTEQFQIVNQDGITKILFPQMPGYIMDNYKVIRTFLEFYIIDSPYNLFIMNHGPCELFIKSLKQSFPKSKLAFVIHDMGWTFKLLGEKLKFIEIIRAINSEETQQNYKNILAHFKEECRMFALVDKVIVLANETMDLLKQTYNVDGIKLFFSKNGLRDYYTATYIKEKKAALKQKLHLAINEKVILYTGRNNEIKGTYSLINSFKQVLKHYSNCRLVIVGTLLNPCAILEHASAATSKISFTGQIPSEKVHEWYCVADIGVLPSYTEQCSYTGIEMMMHGLPVVASDGFCVGDMFVNNRNAIVACIGDRFKPHEFEQNITESILKLLQSENLCIRLGKTARYVYESQYEIHHMLTKYTQLLENIF